MRTRFCNGNTDTIQDTAVPLGVDIINTWRQRKQGTGFLALRQTTNHSSVTVRSINHWKSQSTQCYSSLNRSLNCCHMTNKDIWDAESPICYFSQDTDEIKHALTMLLIVRNITFLPLKEQCPFPLHYFTQVRKCFCSLFLLSAEGCNLSGWKWVRKEVHSGPPS